MHSPAKASFHPPGDRRAGDGATGTTGPQHKEQRMNAEEFMRDHADKASSGRVPEIMGDLTPDSLAQVGALMAGAPQPFTGSSVATVSESGDDYIFDVTYKADAGSLTWRETVRQMDGKWKIVNIVK